MGRRAVALPADLSSADEAKGAVGRAVGEFGRIGFLVNAAGTDVPGTVEELDVQGWDRTLSVNLRRRSCSPRPSSRACARPGAARS